MAAKDNDEHREKLYQKLTIAMVWLITLALIFFIFLKA